MTQAVARARRVKEELADLYSEIELDRLLARIADRVQHHLRCEEAAIFLHDAERDELYFETATGDSAQELKKIVLRRGEGIAGWIAAERRPLIVDDCARDPRFAAGVDRRTRFVTRSILGVPVCHGERLVGVVEAVNRRRGRFGDSDRRLLELISRFVAIPLQNAQLVRRMLEREKTERELQIARRIQRSFLPESPPDLPGVEVAFVNVPSSQVGGDYYDVLPVGGGRTVVSINDVAGHGIPASLLMAIFRTNFVYRVSRDADLGETLAHLNRLIAETTDPSMYVTSFSALLEPAARRMRYVNGGHPPPLRRRAGRVEPLGDSGLPVGMLPEAEHPQAEADLLPGDLLLLFTDGVIEAENPSGEPFSVGRLEGFLGGWGDRPLAGLGEALLAELRAFTGSEVFTDDVTFMAVRAL